MALGSTPQNPTTKNTNTSKIQLVMYCLARRPRWPGTMLHLARAFLPTAVRVITVCWGPFGHWCTWFALECVLMYFEAIHVGVRVPVSKSTGVWSWSALAIDWGSNRMPGREVAVQGGWTGGDWCHYLFARWNTYLMPRRCILTKEYRFGSENLSAELDNLWDMPPSAGHCEAAWCQIMVWIASI